MKTRILILFLTMTVSFEVSSQKQSININSEIRFYKKLFDESSKLYQLKEKTSRVYKNTKLLSDALSTGRVKKVIEQKVMDEAGFATSIVGDIYDATEEFVENYKLPEIEEIPKVNANLGLEGLNSNKQRELINIILTQLTNNSIYYKKKLIDYDITTLDLKNIHFELSQMRRENHKISKDILKYMNDGFPIPWQQYWVFDQIYSKQISKSIKKLNDKKKIWDKNISVQKEKLSTYNSNLILLLQLEKKTLEHEFEKFKQKSEEYNLKLKQIEERILELKIFSSEIEELKNKNLAFNQSISSLESQKSNYTNLIRNSRKTLSFLNDDKRYFSTYNDCLGKPKVSYDNCTHNNQKLKFRKKRILRIKREKKDINNYSKSINRINNRINNYRTNITQNNLRLDFLNLELKDLPIKEIELDELKNEISDYLERIDIFFTRRLLKENENNFYKINSI